MAMMYGFDRPTAGLINETEEERLRRLQMMSPDMAQAAADVAMAPRTDTGTQPVAPTPQGAPLVQPGSMVSRLMQVISPPAAAAAQAPTPEVWQQRLVDAGSDQKRLSSLAYDDAAPENVRREAGQLLYAQLDRSERERRVRGKLESGLESGNMIDFARELQGRDGNLGRALLYNFLGRPDLARQEDIKLGAGQAWQTVTGPDNRPAQVLFRGDGLPVRGYTSTGQRLTAEQLAGVGAAPSGRAQAGMTNFRDMVSGDMYYQREDRGVKTIRKFGTHEVVNDPEILRRLVVDTAGSNAANQNVISLQNLRNKLLAAPQEEYARIIARHNADELTNLPLTMDVQQINNLIQQFTRTIPQPLPGQSIPNAAPAPMTEPRRQPGMTESEIIPGFGGQPRPPAPIPPVSEAPAAPIQPPIQMARADMGTMTDVTAPVTGPIAPDQTVQVAQAAPESPAAARARREAQSKLGAETGQALATSQEAINTLEKGRVYLDILKKGDHNFGSPLAFTGMLGGGARGPIAQAGGKLFETEDARNTQLILDYLTVLSGEGLKATLGTQPSTKDLEFWVKNKPDINSDPAFVKSWIETRLEDLQRRLKYQERATQSGGATGAAIEAPRPRPGTQQNPIRLD